MHMHPPSSMYGPNILSLGGIVIEKPKFNDVSRPWKWGQGQVTHAWLTCTLHDQWTKWGEPSVYACQLSIISVSWVHTNDLQGQARHRSVSTLVRGRIN
jgi:hypothetical protein